MSRPAHSCLVTAELGGTVYPCREHPATGPDIVVHHFAFHWPACPAPWCRLEPGHRELHDVPSGKPAIIGVASPKAATVAGFPALTVRPPWSWALLYGKPVENRSWEMKYRGPVWLHSGARSRWDPAGESSPLVRQAWERYRHEEVPGWPGLPESDVVLGRRTTLMAFGAVTALIEVTGCHHAAACYSRDRDERGKPPLCSPWALFGQFHIERRVLAVLPEPVPCKGALGLWRLPEGVEAAARAQLGGWATCRHCERPIVPCTHAGQGHLLCTGWRHMGYDDQPVIGHCCEGRSVNPPAEPVGTTTEEQQA